MTIEEKRKKAAAAQAKYRETHREKYNEYHNNYMRRRTEEFKKLKEFYDKNNQQAEL